MLLSGWPPHQQAVQSAPLFLQPVPLTSAIVIVNACKKRAVYNHWTGLVDWIGGLDWWTGLVDWIGGLDWWTLHFLC